MGSGLFCKNFAQVHPLSLRLKKQHWERKEIYRKIYRTAPPIDSMHTHNTPSNGTTFTDGNFYYCYSILDILLCMHVYQLVMFLGGQTERRKQGETQKQFHVVCCLRACIDIFTVYTTRSTTTHKHPHWAGGQASAVTPNHALVCII